MAVVSNYTAILSGESWWGLDADTKPVFLTYSFETSAQSYLGDYDYPQAFINGFAAFTTSEQQLARLALQQWDAASGLHLLEVAAGQGDLRFAKYNLTLDPLSQDYEAYGFYPYSEVDADGASDDELAGDVFIDTHVSMTQGLLLHEIGHALGLKHPFDDDPTLTASLDNTSHTVMSYNGPDLPTLGHLDLDAIRALYGQPGADGTQVASWSWDAVTSTLTQTGGAGADIMRGIGASDVMYGGGGDDIVFGGFGNDWIAGGFGDDDLIGGGGDDVLIGGAGNDLLDDDLGSNTIVYAVGGGLDTAFGFQAGADDVDVIDFRGVPTIHTLADVLARTTTVSGNARIDFGNGDRLTLSGVAKASLAVNDFLFAVAKDDFNGDGKSDILFTDNSSDYLWMINDRSIAGQGGVDLFDPSFSVQVTGDFDGDGKHDVLFENPLTGGVYQWQLDGPVIKAQGAVDVGDTSFHLLGTADFNGDGRSDVLWRNEAGFIYQWQMNGMADTPVAVAGLDPSWHVQAAGDFDGDGRADILLRNVGPTANNGAYYLWEMNGAAIRAEAGIDRPDSNWHTLGTGDFDGDGKVDIALRNQSAGSDNGAVWIWLMDGATIKSQGAAGIADAAIWRLAGIGDLSGDGKDDILFRDDAGFFYSWDMNGTSIASEGALPWATPGEHVVTQHWDLV